MHIAHTVYELVRRHPFYVAGRFEGGLEALADFLGCDDVTACRVALCRAPRTGEDLNAWAARIAKRASDIIIASTALMLLAPLWLIIALVIKLDSRGPVFYKQERVGMDGRLFLLYKFRTMLTDAEHELEECGVDLSQPYFKLQDGDPRITRMGRVLRRFSLDELPQLINVLRGDMSLVGPRPLPVEQVAANPGLRPRHEVKAGMTGWWQVSGRSDVDPERALRLDLFYIDNWSLTLDLFILLKTVGTVLSGRGAY